jgi:hypothetical protein
LVQPHRLDDAVLSPFKVTLVRVDETVAASRERTATGQIEPVGLIPQFNGHLARFGDPSGPTCRANFARVLGPLGLDTGSFDGDTCFNAFMRVEYAADGGFVFREPTSRAGDELVLRALRTQIVAVSNCPQARGPANAGSIKPLGVQLR